MLNIGPHDVCPVTRQADALRRKGAIQNGGAEAPWIVKARRAGSRVAYINGSSRIEFREAKRGRLRAVISLSTPPIRVKTLFHRAVEQFARPQLMPRLRGKPGVNICSAWLDKTGCKQHMDRSKLHGLFKRHRGELPKLACELGVGLSTLSNWFLRGMTSARIERAVYDRAEKLLATEEREGHAFGQQHPRLLEFVQARP